jgi:4-amino-4-deoxy-L-arabinose transferase-like glycosyltransferase
VLALTTSFVLALAPPLGWDALAYHFTLARQYALRGDLAVDPVNVFMGMPQVGEMLYTLAVLLRGEGSAQLLGWLTSALAVIGLSSLTGRLIGSRWAPWSAAILFSAPTLAVWPAWGYVDFLTFGAMVATLTVLTIWLRDGQRRSLVLAGILAGVAVSAKYTALSVPVGAGLAILVSAPRSRRLTDALLFTVTAAVVFAPWLLKNAILTGNPVYPLLIDTPEMDAWRHLFYSRPDLIQRDVWHTLGRLPDAVLFGRYGIEHSDATLSPLWLLLPAIGGLAWRRLAADQARDARLMATAFGGAYLVWIVLGQVSQFGALPRLFMPVAAPLMVLAVLGLAAAPALNGPQLRFSWVLQAVVGLVLVVAAGLVGLGFAERQPLLYLAGRQTASDYKRSWQGWYQIAIETVADLPDGARTEFLWEPRALECPERCRADVIADRWYHLGRTLGGADRIVAHWRDLGFTHVLINSGAAEYVRHDPTSLHTPDDWRLLAEVRADLRLVHDFGGAYQLYEIP